MTPTEKENFRWQFAIAFAADSSKESWGYGLSERIAVKKADDLMRTLEELSPDDTIVDCKNGKHFMSTHSKIIHCMFCSYINQNHGQIKLSPEPRLTPLVPPMENP